jgi:hypothetical protein
MSDLPKGKIEFEDPNFRPSKELLQSRSGIAEHMRGLNLGRRVNRAINLLPFEATPDVRDALRNAIASEMLKAESKIADLERRLRLAVEGLDLISAPGDYAAFEHWKETGSYSYYDELSSVKVARETLDKINGTTHGDEPKPQTCHSDRDGDCDWKDCPQLRDGEPVATGRSCPLYDWEDVDERR